MDIPVDADAAGKVFRLVDALEDLDDVQNVFTNVDVPDEVLAELWTLSGRRRVLETVAERAPQRVSYAVPAHGLRLA